MTTTDDFNTQMITAAFRVAAFRVAAERSATPAMAVLAASYAGAIVFASRTTATPVDAPDADADASRMLDGATRIVTSDQARRVEEIVRSNWARIHQLAIHAAEHDRACVEAEMAQVQAAA